METLIKEIPIGEITPELLAVFLPAFDGQPGGVVKLAAQIAEGATLCQVLHGHSRNPAGYFVSRVEGEEIEILAAVSGMSAGTRMVRELLPEIVKAAHNKGCKAVSFETFRPGLMRLMQAAGWQGIAVKMWKAI
jgi:hypothetical protein